MTFSDVAAQLCGQSAVLLGWKPADFWNATPAELGCVFDALAGHHDTPPDADSLGRLMARFPDEPDGDH